MKPLDALRALGPGSEPPAQVKQRVASALGAAIAAAAAAPLVNPSGPASVQPVPASLWGGAVSSKALAIAAGVWLAGGVTGAALYRVLRPTEVRVVYVERPAAPLATSAAPLATSAAPLATSAPPTREPGPESTASSATLGRTRLEPGNAPSSESSSDLTRERSLLDIARADVAHGEPAQALTITERHRRQFPRGRLSEEREALAIRALLSLGRTAEARERARSFRAWYPNSFLNPALDAALATP